MAPLFPSIVSHVKPFWFQLCYFFIVSLMGYLALYVFKPRTDYVPNDLDLFFTSVSATTVSSMSIVEMEVFSNGQLIVMTILMLLGGEVFTSLLSLQFQRFKLSLSRNKNILRDKSLTTKSFMSGDEGPIEESYIIKSLGYVVLGYLIIVHVVGSSLVSLYICLTPSANNVLKNKGLLSLTFAVFITVSTFANGGFVPTNESMIVFRNNSGLLLILLPLIFLGNTLYPLFLRLSIGVLARFIKRKEYTYMLNNSNELSYGHLMSRKESWFLAGTALLLLVVQFVMFCIMEWSSEAMEGMSPYEKLVGSLFQTANSRHSGEAIVDFSIVSSAILVLFVVMMYLPPYTSFLPIGDQEQEESNRRSKKQKNNIIENMLFSQLSYLAIFVIIICIIERKNLKDDPLNFSVLNIVVEVISAYGNVGISTGYSCKRRLKSNEYCKDTWYGFVGRWSTGGKVVLILVMFFGRLKKFNMHGGKAWKLRLS